MHCLLKMYGVWVVFTFCLFFEGALCHAQSYPLINREYQVDFYNIDSGLPANTVYDFAHDDLGFLWIATSGGLARFDGYSFEKVNFPIDPVSNSRENTANRLRFFDSLGLLVFSRNQLFQYNHYRHELIPHPLTPTTLEESFSDLLFFEEELFYLETATRRLVRLDENFEETTHQMSGVLHATINGDKLWILHEDSVVIHDNIDSYSSFQLPEKLEHWYGVMVYPAIFPSVNPNAVWLRTVNEDYTSRLFYLHADGNIEEIPFGQNWIRSIIEDNYGRLWLLTSTGGLFTMDVATRKVTLFEQIEQIPLLSIYMQDDVIWVGSNGGGIFSIDISPQRFNLIKTGPLVGDFQLGHLIRHLFKYEDYLYLVQFLTPNEFQKINLRTMEARRFEFEKREALHTFFGAYTRNGTDFWVMMREAKFTYLNTETGYQRQLNLENTYSYIGILAESDTHVWGASDRSIYILDKSDWTQRHIPLLAEDSTKRGIHIFQFNGSLDEVRNKLWFTIHNKIATLDLTTDELQYHEFPEVRNNLMKYFKFHGENLWIASEVGLFYYKPESGEYRFFDDRDGLPDNFLYGFQMDRHGNLWIGSNAGIIKATVSYDSEWPEPSFRSFSLKDGMQSMEFNTYAYFTDSDGYVWMGGIGGINYFHPDSISDDQNTPRIVFSDFRLFSEPASLDTSIHYKKHLIIPYDQYDFTIGFTGLSPRRSDEIRYSWQMAGQDRDWITSNGTRSVRYTNLSPGNYQFKVRAANYDGVWGEPSILNITITAPFWHSTWFLVLSIMLGGALITGIVRFASVRKYKLRLMELEKINMIREERSRIARDLHDEIGSKLTQIALLSESLHHEAREQLHDTTSLQKVSRVARENIRNLSEIVWALNPQNDSLENVASYIQNYTEKFFENTKTRVLFDIQEHFPDQILASNIRHNLLMSVKEFLNNTLKYAEAGVVEVTISADNQRFYITLTDDGKGFDPETVAQKGNGLHHIKTRIPPFGGEVFLSSSPGKGCTVMFILPIES